MEQKHIGVFDSGVGGLTVLREITRVLPEEPTVYLGDSGRAPYGQLEVEVIRRYTLEALDFLYDAGVKALVVACNTATAVALEDARGRYDVPVIGVIGPTARIAAGVAGRRVGIIGTETTVASDEYTRAIASLNPGLEVHQKAAPLLAGFVEMGDLSGPVTHMALTQYVEPLLMRGIDTLVLGCTHYPFLRLSVDRLVGPGVSVIESGPPVAHELAGMIEAGLVERGVGRPATPRLMTTGRPDGLRKLAALLWPDDPPKIEQVDIEVTRERLHLQAT